MQAVLCPMNPEEILNRTFEIYRKRFLPFAGIAALPAAVMPGIHAEDIVRLHSRHEVYPRSSGLRLNPLALAPHLRE
jgi:hypothetical protein